MLCYALIGTPTLVVPEHGALSVAFSIIMNAGAGPQGRYDLLSRWMIVAFLIGMWLAS